MSNIDLSEAGSITERDVFEKYNTVSSPFGNNYITFVGKFYTSTAKHFLSCGGTTTGLGSAGAFTDISSTYNTVTNGSYWSAVSFQNKYYLFNPTIPMQIYDEDHSNIYQSPDYPTTNCPYAAVHKARTWAGGSSSIPYRLYMSALNNADLWTDYIDLPDFTQKITGLISWGGYLYIYTETDIYILLGSTPKDFSLRKTNSQVGAIAPRTIKISDIGIISLARTGLFTFNGNNSEKLSDKVEPLINDISKTNIQNACGIFDGQGRYLLSYTHKTSTYNDKIVILDTILKEWYAYDNLNISYFAKASGGTDRGEIYGGSAMNDGIVWQLQKATGTESVTHSTQTQLRTGVTFNTVFLGTNSSPIVELSLWKGTSYNDTKLLLHLDGSDGATSTTDFGNTNHSITFEGASQLDTAEKKFGSSSLFLKDDYLELADSDDWDICGSNSDDWTVELWVKFTDHVGYEAQIGQTLNGDNRWYIIHSDTDNGFIFKLVRDGVSRIDTTWAGEVSDTDWHHIAMCKVANEYGLYKDGIQIGYATSDYTTTLPDAPLNVGRSTTADLFDGHLDEVRIQHSNVFNASPNVGKTDTITIPENYSSSGTLTSDNFQINASEQETLDTISWFDTVSSTTKVSFQTRTGATDDSVYFNAWEYWSSANSVTFDTVTSNTAYFTSSNNLTFLVSRDTALSRNILYYEPDDNVSPNHIKFVTYGAVSTDDYAEWTIPITDISSYNWLSGWYKSPETENSVVFYFGEGVSSDNYITFNTVEANTWERWYWYIGNITSTDRDAVNYIKLLYYGDTAGEIVLGETSLYNFYDSGDTMTSTPDDWIQYRAILGTEIETTIPMLTSVILTYTPQLTVQETSLSTYYYTKWLDFGMPLKNKQFLDFFLDVYNDDDSVTNTTVVYCDYDIDDGENTGTISCDVTTTGNSVKFKKYFPSSTFGRTMRLKFYNNDKDAKIKIRAVEIRYRPEEFQ